MANLLAKRDQTCLQDRLPVPISINGVAVRHKSNTSSRYNAAKLAMLKKSDEHSASSSDVVVT